VFVEVEIHAGSADRPIDPQKAIALFESSPQQEIPITDADPRLGPEDAPVRMVVFSDFQCPGCLHVWRTIPGLVRQFEDKLQIVFKHYPLDNTCNRAVKIALHPKACLAAQASEAARKQGKFWPFHVEMFTPRGKGKIVIKKVAEQLGLDVERFEADRVEDAGLARIQADIELGISLGVDGTPSLFIDGRRVYDTRRQMLQFLIDHQIKHGGHVEKNN